MTKLLSIFMLTLLFSSKTQALWDSFFPEVKYSNTESKQILDLIFGDDSSHNISARKDISVKIAKKQQNATFDDPKVKNIGLTPTRIDTCEILIDLMSTFYLAGNDNDVRLEFSGLKTNVIGSSDEKLLGKANAKRVRQHYTLDDDLHIVLTKNFFKENQEKLNDSFNFCTTSNASSILINKNKQLSQLREISIKHNSVFDANRNLDKKNVQNDSKSTKASQSKSTVR